MIFLINLVTALYCSCLPVPEITLQENPPKQEVIQYSSRLCEGDRLQFGNKAIQFKKWCQIPVVLKVRPVSGLGK